MLTVCINYDNRGRVEGLLYEAGGGWDKKEKSK